MVLIKINIRIFHGIIIFSTNITSRKFFLIFYCDVSNFLIKSLPNLIFQFVEVIYIFLYFRGKKKWT